MLSKEPRKRSYCCQRACACTCLLLNDRKHLFVRPSVCMCTQAWYLLFSQLVCFFHLFVHESICRHACWCRFCLSMCASVHQREWVPWGWKLLHRCIVLTGLSPLNAGKWFYLSLISTLYQRCWNKPTVLWLTVWFTTWWCCKTKDETRSISLNWTYWINCNFEGHNVSMSHYDMGYHMHNHKFSFSIIHHSDLSADYHLMC